MSDAVTKNLILETLKQIEGTLAEHSLDIREINERLGLLERQFASISRRVDRIDDRLERVEKRLDLAEA